MVFAALAVGCAGAVPSQGPARSKDPRVPDSVNVALARARGQKQLFEWQPLSAAAFERAKRERRYVLLHGAAEWCHWCHVMEETTYVDPEVGRVLRDRFVTIRVDVDSRPDIEQRYAEWGWPATILFSPDGEEIGKFRGYLPPEELSAALADVERLSLGEAEDGEPGPSSASVESLPWVAARVRQDMASYYDAGEGGWGMRQKAPIADNALYELVRGQAGDAKALARALFSLEKQRAVMDPVWGGLYQYSDGGTWDEPHFEKLMTVQAPNLEAYALAHRLSKRADLRRDAEAIVRYVDRFLTSPEGTFYTNQDADVGSHDDKARFVHGHDYYSKPENERKKLGVPWVDTHVYAYENGLMIAALVTLYEATNDERVLARARRAADRLLATHLDAGGGVRREKDTASGVRFLIDAASFGRACTRLAEVTRDERYRAAAVAIAKRARETLLDPATAAFRAHTPDPGAAGVFARPRRPFRHNVMTARFFAAVGKLTGDAELTVLARRTLAAIATPAALDAQGRMVGGYLLALEEAGVSQR
jgi:uncharacterized protein